MALKCACRNEVVLRMPVGLELLSTVMDSFCLVVFPKHAASSTYMDRDRRTDAKTYREMPPREKGSQTSKQTRHDQTRQGKARHDTTRQNDTTRQTYGQRPTEARTCRHTHTDTCIQTDRQTHTHTHARTHTGTHTHTCSHMRARAHTHSQTHRNRHAGTAACRHARTHGQ